jgi:hypothetical protein
MVYVVFYDGVDGTYSVRKMTHAQASGAVSVFDTRSEAWAHVAALKNG